jgi:hypothetical protein
MRDYADIPDTAFLASLPAFYEHPVLIFVLADIATVFITRTSRIFITRKARIPRLFGIGHSYHNTN